jgi:hypothetical protein
MIDAPNHARPSVGGLPSYEELEGAVFGSAAAIHSLTTDRDDWRSRCEIQERELEFLRATNDELRRQLVLIGESYVKFATSCVVQLEHVGHAMQIRDGSANLHTDQSAARG